MNLYITTSFTAFLHILRLPILHWKFTLKDPDILNSRACLYLLPQRRVRGWWCPRYHRLPRGRGIDDWRNYMRRKSNVEQSWYLTCGFTLAGSLTRYECPVGQYISHDPLHLICVEFLCSGSSSPALGGLVSYQLRWWQECLLEYSW